MNHPAIAAGEHLTTYTGPERKLGGAQNLAVWTRISEFAGGTNVVISVEGKDRLSGQWGTIKTFAARTATGLYRDVVLAQTDGPLPLSVRVKGTVTGTFTQLAYSVSLDTDAG